VEQIGKIILMFGVVSDYVGLKSSALQNKILNVRRLKNMNIEWENGKIIVMQARGLLLAQRSQRLRRTERQ